MGKNYAYVLSIDIGIASIGTAVIRLSEDGNASGILDAGVRIFDIPLGAEARRLARQVRTTLRRRKARLAALRSLLQKHQLLPTDYQELTALMRCSPYKLRANAIYHPLQNLHEFGRCLMHLAKFRGAGFLSQQEDMLEKDQEGLPNSGTKNDAPKTAGMYRTLERVIAQNNISLSDFFLQRLRSKKDKGRIRRRARFVKDNIIDYAVPRFLVKDDFHKMWHTQSKKHETLTIALKNEIYSVIFRDRPHAPYSNAFCSLNPSSKEPRLPKMHRLSEERRIYEQINNIRFHTASGMHVLTRVMRDLLTEKLLAGEALTKTSIKSYIQNLCDHPIIKINMPDDTTKIKPHAHIRAFASIPSWNSFSQAKQDAIVDFMSEPRIESTNPHSRLMPEEDFLEECARRMNLTDIEATKLVSQCLSALPKGRTALGVTATTKIVEKLQTGITNAQNLWQPLSNREAADACNFVAEEEILRKRAGTMDYLPYYGEALPHDVSPIHPWHIEKRCTEEEATYGRIPNPVVHVALNQLRKLINEIVVLYGKPQRIHVELAREFGMSRVKREQMEKEQKDRAKENDAIDAELIKHGIPASRKNRIKYRLWKEQGHEDIYSLQPIQIKDFMNCEIDHIIPQPQGGTDTFSNLALTVASNNFAKQDSFAHAFIQTKFPNQWQCILKKITSTPYSPRKAWRFMPDAGQRFTAQGDDDQTDHRLTDTSYMSKIATRYLSLLCATVLPLRGGMTAHFRHLWGLDGLEYDLMGLEVRPEIVDSQTGEVTMDLLTNKPKRNAEWKAKPRIDHRHHALDAVVLACVTRSMMQKLLREQKLGKRLSGFPVPFGENAAAFRQHVLVALQRIKVSPKPEHGLQGQLCDATKYRILCPVAGKQNMYVIRYRRKFETLKSKESVAKVAFSPSTFPTDVPIIQETLRHCAYQANIISSLYERAEAILRQRMDEQQKEGKKLYEIGENHIVQEAIHIAQRENKDFGHCYQAVQIKTLVGICPKRQCGFDPNGNLCLDFFANAQGKVGWECITRFDASQQDFMPQWERDGHKLIWRLYKGDVLELTVDANMKATLKLAVPAGKVLCVVQKFSQGKMQVNLLHDARPLDAKLGAPRWLSGDKGLSIYTATQARKIELTPFGKVRRKHAKLWNGKKTAQK